MGKVFILTAVTLEARAIARALLLRKASAMLYLDEAYELHVVGIRAGHLPDLRQATGGVILAGLGGGLDPTLKVGDVVVDGLGALPDGLAQMRVWMGSIVCAKEVVETPEAKAQLFAATGAIAVEMEGDQVRKAMPAGKTLLHVRGISDGANDGIDPAIMSLVDEFGRTRVGAVAGAILRRPGRLPGLMKLKKDSEKASQSMAETVVRILRSGWSGTTG